jgi:RNA polymerase sigma-70 factor, ECF subfamily
VSGSEVMNEHLLVAQRAAAGDDDALAILVDAYHDRVQRFGLRVCRDRFDAEDAVQEAFARLARRPDVQRDQGALSWLMTVVRNLCLRMVNVVLRARPIEDSPSDLPDPEAALERFDIVQRVHAAIAKLPRDQREVLILRDLEGMSGDQVCQALTITSAAMKSRLHRARASVREELAGKVH